MKRLHQQESLSGQGSWLRNTRETVEFINKVIDNYKIRSILDVGCGDWNWFKHVDIRDLNYLGWDADEQMINSNQSQFGSANIQFEVKDIVTSDYPKVDLVICRDVLFHMEFNTALAVIDRARESSNLLISTSYRDNKVNTGPRVYTDFDDWGYYDLNLSIEPFNLEKYETDSLQELKNTNKSNRRFICLYKFTNLAKDQAEE